MLLFDGFFGLVMLGLWLFCIIDVITTDESQCRNLPKLVWILLVLLLPDIGSIAWLVAGRQWASASPNLPYKGNTGRPQEHRRPGRATATNPDDDEDFLLRLRERAEQQRREHRLRSEQERREDPPV